MKAAGMAVSRLTQNVVHSFDLCIALSSDLENFYLSLGVDPRRITIIPTGVDPLEFYPPSSKEKRAARLLLNLDPEAIIFLFCGRLVKSKGIQTLIDAWGNIGVFHEKAELIIIGDVSDDPSRGVGQKQKDHKKTRAWVNDLDSARRILAGGGLSRVQLIGFSRQVPLFLRAADIFVFPSLNEGLPNVVIEAMMTGLPVIGSRIPGNTDLIRDNYNGLLFRPSDSQDLARKMLVLLENPELRERFGAINREIAERKLAIAKIADIYLELIQTI